MEYRKLGNLDVSAIGLGTLRTFDVTDDDEIAVRRQIVDNCLNSNVNLIDTAAWYGHGEQFVGEITEDLRDQFYIATKVRAEGKEAGEAQITRSFELLKTDYNDLFQVHNMIDWWQTHLPTLEQLKPGSTEGRGQAGETDEGGPGEVIFWDGFRIDGNGGGRWWSCWDADLGNRRSKRRPL